MNHLFSKMVKHSAFLKKKTINNYHELLGSVIRFVDTVWKWNIQYERTVCNYFAWLFAQKLRNEAWHIPSQT